MKKVYIYPANFLPTRKKKRWSAQTKSLGMHIDYLIGKRFALVAAKGKEIANNWFTVDEGLKKGGKRRRRKKTENMVEINKIFFYLQEHSHSHR